MRRMKYLIMLLLVLSLAFSPQVVFADATDKATLGGQDSSGYYHWRVTSDGSLQSGNEYYTWTYGTGMYRITPIGIRNWQNVCYPDLTRGDGSVLAGFSDGTSAGSPNYVTVAGGADYIVFYGPDVTPSDDNTISAARSGSPIEYTFTVPPDYRTTPTFIVKCANGSADVATTGTTNYIDWDIVVNSSGSAVSSTRYDQTPVALTANVNMQDVTLTYSTSTDITAGDSVTVRIWRVMEATKAGTTGRNSTSDLRVYDVAFKYIAQW